MDCIFCDITQKKKDADIVKETERLVVFRDINPKAPVHLLIVPKKHITSIKEITEDDRALIGDMFLMARDIAKQFNLAGYKLIFNVGREGGQLVDHLHLHVLGGWETASSG